MKNHFIIARIHDSGVSPSFCHKPLGGAYGLSLSDGYGTGAFLFTTRKDAEYALDQLPHGEAKNCRIVEITEAPTR